LIAFLAYQTHLLNAGADLIDQLNTYKMLSVNLERLSDIVLTEPERQGFDVGRPKLEAHSARLEVRNASFRYSAQDSHVLNDACLSVAPGECVVIMGASGAGKSTLIRVMLGFEQLEHGTVLFADTDI
jgi:ATP-binding cassette subfamily B protein RaxB